MHPRALFSLDESNFKLLFPPSFSTFPAFIFVPGLVISVDLSRYRVGDSFTLGAFYGVVCMKGRYHLELDVFVVHVFISAPHIDQSPFS